MPLPLPRKELKRERKPVKKCAGNNFMLRSLDVFCHTQAEAKSTRLYPVTPFFMLSMACTHQEMNSSHTVELKKCYCQSQRMFTAAYALHLPDAMNNSLTTVTSFNFFSVVKSIFQYGKHVTNSKR